MIGTELLRRLRVAIQDGEEPYRFSTDQLWRWIQASYMGIQRQSQQWGFMHKRGLFITTQSGVEVYAAGNLREIADQSLYYRQTDSAAHIPISVLSYETWAYEQQAGVIRNGSPLFLVENPDHTWRPYPIPNGVYLIYADWWLRAAEMEDQTSSPIWDEEYHEILLYSVMELAAGLEPDSSRSALMLAESAKFLPGLQRAFNQRYLPNAVSPGPLL